MVAWRRERGRGGVPKRPTGGAFGGCGRRRTAPAGFWPQAVVRNDRQGFAPPAATGSFHLAPADRGMTPEPQRLATGWQSHRPPEGEGLSPRSRSTEQAPDVSAQAPQLPVGSSGPWPPEGDRGAQWRPSPPRGQPAGRNFGKEGATPSTRSCPREPFARDPVQCGDSDGRVWPWGGAGISLLGDF